MSAADQRRRNDGSDRARDRAARRLLLEEVLAEDPQPMDPAVVNASTARSGGAFAAALLIALALAGASWTVASLIARTPTAARGSPVASNIAKPTDLLFRIGGGDPGREERMEDVRRQVLALAGRVQTGPIGEIGAIEIDASRLRALVQALEGEGLGVLEVLESDPVAPVVAEGPEWQEWSERLRVRRALRRAERLGGTLVVGLQESG